MPVSSFTLKQDFGSALASTSLPVEIGTISTLKSASPGLTEQHNFIPVDSSGVGEFPWQWNEFGTFNGDTWGFLNNIATQSKQGYISLTAGLTTFYYNIISATVYLWTEQDRGQLEKLLAESRSLQDQIISIYVLMFSAIGPPEKALAAAALERTTVSGLSYVIEYRIGFQWSGRQDAGLTPLAPKVLRSNGFEGLFKNAPSGAREAFVGPLEQMIECEKKWATLIDTLWKRSRSVRAAANNTSSPELTNKSGMYVIKRDGSNLLRHSFLVSPAVYLIREQLSAATTMTVKLLVEMSSKKQAKLPKPKQEHAAKSVIGLQSESGASENLLDYDGIGDEAEVNVIYHGPTVVTTRATAFESEAASGWFYEHPIAEAAKNHAQDIEQGYQFQLPIGDDLGSPETGLGLIKSLLVCRSVTVQVLCPKGDAQRLKASVPIGLKVSATLLDGINVTGGPRQSHVITLENDPKRGTPIIVLKTEDGGQTGTPGPFAHVIGAQIYGPSVGDGSPSKRKRSMKMKHFNPPGTTLHHATPEGSRKNIVTVYERIFGPISQDQISSTQFSTKSEFIEIHVIGGEWSGRLKAILPPLALSEMRLAHNLLSLFPDMPLEGAEVLTELQEYLSRH